ncbi:aspartic peptidase domain-containing protein [Xylariaceae sp. FL1651]|nr:aspartic peptidase domain-containing protein [Xylariaceae sp. FL1651]
MLSSTFVAFLASLMLTISATPLAHTQAIWPDRVIERTTPTITGSATATSFSDGYFGQITVDGANYSVLFDTGSSALWINNKASVPVSGPAFSITYGSGKVNGTVTSGTVTIGGLTISNQSYGVATSVDSHYSNWDGILGLGQSTTQFGGSPTWMANAMPQFKQPVFGVNIPPTGQATFTFGYNDTTHEKTPLATNKATYSTSGWYQNVTSFNIPGINTSLICNLDTGTTDILVPSSIAWGFWNQVKTATPQGDNMRWTFPCVDNATVPDFWVTIGGNKYMVAARDTYFTNKPSQGLCGSKPHLTFASEIGDLVGIDKLIFTAASNTGQFGRRVIVAATAPGEFIHASNERVTADTDMGTEPLLSTVNSVALGCSHESYGKGHHTSISGTPFTAAVVANITEFLKRQRPGAAEKFTNYLAMGGLFQGRIT